MLLVDYFLKEIETYKKDQVREQTYGKYLSNCRFVADNWPGLSLEKMTATIFGHFLIFWKSLKLISLENS